jgi:hypothetical protein
VTRETKLIKAPSVVAIKTTVYRVSWTWLGETLSTCGDTPDEEEVRHVKTCMTKHAAYRHAAWGYILNRKSLLGCDKNKCAFGDLKYLNPDGDKDDTRCKYCNDDKVMVLAARLTRWLKWRDSRTIPQPAPEVKR